jgi:hypothetical protein
VSMRSARSVEEALHQIMYESQVNKKAGYRDTSGVSQAICEAWANRLDGEGLFTCWLYAGGIGGGSVF